MGRSDRLNPWRGPVPEKYRVGDIVTGEVTKIHNFGVLVKLEEGLEGLLPISELADKEIGWPEEVVRVGQAVDVKIIEADSAHRRIVLGLEGRDVEPGGAGR